MQSTLNVVSRKLQTTQEIKNPQNLLFCSSLGQKFLPHVCVKDQVLAGLHSSTGESIFITFPAQSMFSIFKSRLSSFHIISSNLFCTITYPFDFLLPSTFFFLSLKMCFNFFHEIKFYKLSQSKYRRKKMRFLFISFQLQQTMSVKTEYIFIDFKY